MYAAQYGSLDNPQRLTFEASGSLWRDALVMKDRQTGTMWSQVFGIAIEGEQVGDTLDLYTSEFITFGALKDKYPEAKLLKKDARSGPGSYYKRYFDDPDRIGIFGNTFDSDELGAKSMVLGLRTSERVVAVPIDSLNGMGVARIDLPHGIALVFYDPASLEAFALMISSENVKSSGFTLDDNLQAEVSGVKHSPAELQKLEVFESMPLVTSYWFAWKSFFPNAEIVYPHEVKK